MRFKDILRKNPFEIPKFIIRAGESVRMKKQEQKERMEKMEMEDEKLVKIDNDNIDQESRLQVQEDIKKSIPDSKFQLP